MSDFAIAGDARELVFVAGKLQLVRGVQARRQKLDIGLHHFQGEWYYDQSAGTDYFGKIFGKSTDLARRAEIRRRVLSVPGIVEVQRIDLSLDPRSRAVSGKVEARDVTGETVDVALGEVL